ncbi:hypothetical protein TrST_g82 [Triparma strigata]|uniref:Uncharacterized protein n=1 Tax=Triparma strigata TaxID=1606541 RepID=A0A9W7BGN2_9STRA|nr:hypothetical protein TrST_g82 [Triparma strigata]
MSKVEPDCLMSALYSLQVDLTQTSKNPPSSEMSSPLNSIDVSELISSLLLCTSCSHCSPSPSDSDKSAIIFYAYKSLSALISLNPLLPSPSLARACLRKEVWDNILGVLGRDSPVDVVTLACKCLFYLTESDLHSSALMNDNADSADSVDSRFQSSDSQKSRSRRNSFEDSSPPEEAPPVFPIDRAISAVVEHITSAVLATQRWSVATISNILSLDNSSLNTLTSSGGLMILTSLLNSSDDDTKSHASYALQSAVTISNHSETLLNNIATSLDYNTMSTLLSPNTSTDNIIKTTAGLLGTLLLPITSISNNQPTSTNHPSYTIAINLHTPRVIQSLVALLTSSSTTSVLVCLAGIANANGGSDILPKTDLGNLCMTLLSNTPSDSDNKHLLQQILTTFTPDTQNPTTTLSSMLRGNLLSAAHTLIQSFIVNPSTSFELLLTALDAGVVSLILNALSVPSTPADECSNLEMLAILGKIAYSPSSPAPEVAKERYESSINYYEMVHNSDVVSSLTKFLVISDDLFDMPESQKQIKCNSIKATLSILSSFTHNAADKKITTEIVHSLFLPSPSVIQSLLVQPPSPSLLSPTLEIFAKVCENAPSPVLPQLASCAACSIVPDMLSNAQSMADYDSFLLCLSIVTSTGSHAPPTSTVGRSSINTIKQALERPNCPELVRKKCVYALESLSINSSLWTAIGSCLSSLTAALLEERPQSRGVSKSKDSQLEAACLTTIARIIPLPSNASMAAQSGIAIPLSSFVTSNPPLARQALEVLHAMCRHKIARVTPSGHSLINQGVLKAACYALTSFPKSDALALKSLEILSECLGDKEAYSDTNSAAIIEAVNHEPNIVRVLCASLGLSIARSMNMDPDIFLDVYSKWKTQFNDEHSEMVRKVLFAFAAHYTRDDGVFWTNFGYGDIEGETPSENVVVVSAMCCDMLSEMEGMEEGNLGEEGEFAKKAPLVKNKLLAGLAKCLKNGTVELEDTIVNYELFDKAVNATALDPGSPMISELLENYSNACVKALLQSEDCLKATSTMLSHSDARASSAAANIFATALGVKAKQTVGAVQKAGVRETVMKGLSEIAFSSSKALAALNGLAAMGLSDYEATTLSVSLTTSLVNEVVAKEGDLSDDDEVYKLLCLLSSSKAGLKTVTSLGGLVALSLLASKGKVSALQCLLAADASQVIESEGHLSAVNVVCNRSDGVEAVRFALRLLTSLFAPAISDDCWPAVDKSVELILSSDPDHVCDCLKLLIASAHSVSSKKKLLESNESGLGAKLSSMLLGETSALSVELLTALVPHLPVESASSCLTNFLSVLTFPTAGPDSTNSVLTSLHHLPLTADLLPSVIASVTPHLKSPATISSASFLLLNLEIPQPSTSSIAECLLAVLEAKQTLTDDAVTLLCKLTRDEEIKNQFREQIGGFVEGIEGRGGDILRGRFKE